MPFKTILVHIAHDEGRKARLAAAIDLAGSQGAFLDLVYTTSPAAMPAAITGRGASSAYIAEAIAIAEEKSADIRAECEAACRAAGVEYDWEVVSGDQDEVLSARSHAAELMVVGQPPGPSVEEYVGLYSPVDFLVDTHCPIIIIPFGFKPAPIGRRPLVAWKDCREAGAAVRGAMPILETAGSAIVLTIEERGRRSDASREVGEMIRRHGVEVERLSVALDGSEGETLLAAVAAQRADLLVMGVYSRPRWREMVLGGMSQFVLDHMTVPVFAAH